MAAIRDPTETKTADAADFPGAGAGAGSLVVGAPISGAAAVDGPGEDFGVSAASNDNSNK